MYSNYCLIKVQLDYNKLITFKGNNMKHTTNYDEKVLDYPLMKNQ